MATFGIGPNPYTNEGPKMTNMIYEASVYSRTVSYRNLKGEDKTQTLYFALDPLQLMSAFAGYEPKKVKSGNPSRNNQDAEFTEKEQLEMVRDLAVLAAGIPSLDGETWTPYVDFDNDVAGKAFLTKLVASDGDRKEFAEKVIMAPLRAFVEYAEADPSNTPAEVQEFRAMLNTMEKMFIVPEKTPETMEDRRARLAAEMAALDAAGSDAVPPTES